MIKWIFRHIPFVMRLYRNILMARVRTRCELEGSMVDRILQADLAAAIFSKENKVITQLAKKVRLLYNNQMSSKLPKSSF